MFGSACDQRRVSWLVLACGVLTLGACGRSPEADRPAAKLTASSAKPSGDQPSSDQASGDQTSQVSSNFPAAAGDLPVAAGDFPAGHRRMVDLLDGLASTTATEHPWLETATAEKLERQLIDLPDGTSLFHRCQLLFQSGTAEVRIGNVEKAIKRLTAALELFPASQQKSKAANNLRFELAVAYLRYGETQNCCLRNAPESCIVPIRGAGLHTRPEGSRGAIRYLQQVLTNTPKNDYRFYEARWLLNLAYMTLGEYPDGVPPEYLLAESTFESEVDFPQFANVAPGLGLNTFNLSGGVVIDDFDNDHDLDVMASTWDPEGQVRYFRNNQDGTFLEVTESAGLTGLTGGLNMLQADYDNDGFLDFLILRGAWLARQGRQPNSLVRNNGDGTFTDVTFEAGLGEVHYPTQTADWADYDNDGDLDLYIGNETGAELTSPCQLFRNNGDGTFTDVGPQAGVTNLGYTKGVSWGDFNQDRFPDLYVSNLEQANRLYRNNQDGTFTDVAEELKVTAPVRSFPTWFWDFDNDGVLDIFAGSYQGGVGDLALYYQQREVKSQHVRLYRGMGDGKFQDVTEAQQLVRPVLSMGANFGDLNSDGFLDFYIGTGDPEFGTLIPNAMFLNQQTERFVDVTMAGGFGHLQKGHAVAFADIDNDGDLDVFEQMGGARHGDEFGDVLYENPGFGHTWITIELVGKESNRSAIGARLRLEVVGADGVRLIFRHINSGGSFGGNPLRQCIGLGEAGQVKRLDVFWPKTGRTQEFQNVAAGRMIRIVENEETYTEIPTKAFRLENKQVAKPVR